MDEIESLRAELAEQSRLLGMSGEREAKLIAQRDRLAEALRGMLKAFGYDLDNFDMSGDAMAIAHAHAALESLK